MPFQLWKWLDIRSKWKAEITSLLSISLVSGNWADCKERIPNSHAWRLWGGGLVYFWCNIKSLLLGCLRSHGCLYCHGKKDNRVFNKAKASAHSFCLILLQSLHESCMVGWCSWAGEHAVQRLRVQITERGRISFFVHLELCTLRIGRNQKLFQINQSASQTWGRGVEA